MTKAPRPPRSRPLLRDDAGPIQSRVIRKRDKEQPALPFDVMPSRVEPALALLKAKPPAGDQWQWEVKWDGYRLAIHVESTGVRILTRGGYDWADRFPGIEAAARALGPATMILDGEGVVLDAEGRSDFNALQNSLGGVGRRSGNKLAGDAIFMAFDLLYLDGHDLRGLEYQERRQLLEGVLHGEDGAIRLSEAIEADPVALFESACGFGLEGIIGKDRASPYRSGRTGDWVKLKCVRSESFFIVGYEQGSGFGGFSSLLLAAYRGDNLEYVGSVGTGFKEGDALKLRSMLDKLTWKRKVPPVRYGGKRPVRWVQPTLIAEIEFRQWTFDLKLRHAAYKGLRERQDNADVYRLED